MTFSSDVYAFGVLIFELLSGQHGADTESEVKLVDKLQPYFQNGRINIGEFIDEKLLGEYDVQAAMSLAAIAKRCVSEVRDDRPEMVDVNNEIQALVNRTG